MRYLRSASSPVPDTDARKIRAYVRSAATAVVTTGDGSDGAEQPPPATAGQTGVTGEADQPSRAGQPGQADPVDAPPAGVAEAAAALGLDPAATGRIDPDVAATAAALGVDFSSGRATYRRPEDTPRRSGRRDGQQPARATGRQSGGRVTSQPVGRTNQAGGTEPELQGIAAEIRRHFEKLSATEAERLGASYARKDVTAEAAAPYWAAGLGPYDLDAIAQCIRSELHPADLALLIDGRSVVNRLRGGEPVDLLRLQLPR